MENTSKAVRGRRKENIPPHLSSTKPEPRNIQKNVNIDLCLDPFNDVAVSRHSSGASGPASCCSRLGSTAAHGKSQVASLRGARPHHRPLVQTNLQCPSQLFWDTPRGVPGGSFRQQSNLETKLGCRRSEDVACTGNPSSLCAGGIGSSYSCLKSSPRNDFSNRRQKPREGLGLCGVSHPCNVTSQARIGNKDPHVLKVPRGCFSTSGGCYRPLGTVGEPFCPTNLRERPSACSFLRGRRFHPESPSQSLSSSPPGPPLTLEHLRSATSGESHAASTTLQVLLSSSRVSAELHSSLQRLKEEAASMGALSSFPWEPRPSPRPPLPRLDPQGFASGRPSVPEQRVGEESCAKQASMKWRNSFARDWGLGSTTGSWEEPHPFGYGCRNTGLSTHTMEASDPFWPPAFYGGVGSTSLVCRAEEVCSNPAFCYLGCCSRTQQGLERKDPSGHPQTCCQKTPDAEELSSRFFHPPEVGCGDTLLCRPSFDSLEVSLETWHARPPVTVGVTVDGTQREVHVVVRSPEVGRLGNGSENMDLCGLQDGLEDVDGVLPTLQAADEAVLFLPACNSSEEIAGGRLGDHSSTAMDGLGPAGFGEMASGSKNSSNQDCWADVVLDGDEESSTEKNAGSSRFPRWEESRHRMEAVQKETLGRNDGAMDGERSRVPLQSAVLLVRCFAVWRHRVFGRRAAVQALCEQQLLRRGFGALKWAVQQGHIQAGIAQRRHSRRVLEASFRRWQEATARRRKERASRVETEARKKDSPAALGGETIANGLVLCQLSTECLEAATQYGRAEGNLWLQILRNQGVDKLYRKAQAIRDMRRLAAAFRLWCLQKERLDEEESRAQEACSLLEKKRLRSAFETWQSHHRATEQIWPLVAQIQRRLVSRCFNTWKAFAEREACGRHSRDHRRVGALRLCFRQWARMGQVQERTRKVLLELLALRQKAAYARFGFALNVPKTQPYLCIVRQSQRIGPDTLDGLYAALALQGTFYTWKERWHQQQLLHAFRQTTEQTLLREALGQWRWKAACLAPLTCCTRDLPEEPLLASLDSDEFSASSGFHSNAPALPASRDWRETEGSLMGSRPASISSLVTITDSGHLLHHLSPSQTPPPGREGLGDDAVAFRVQASSPLRNQCSRKDGFQRDPFRSLEFLSPECGVPSIAAPSSGEGGNSRGEEKEIFENQRHLLLARCFALWSSRTLQNSKGKQLRRRGLLSWAFASWSAATARSAEQRKARVFLESGRQRRLLSSCFERWKVEVWRTHEQRAEEGLRRRRAGCKAVRLWRKAVRGSQALRLGTGTVVQQSSNYWTKAAAFHLCLRQRSSLVRAPKFLKMPLSWPSKQRRNREEGLPPSLAVRARLNGSAFHVWLVVYRSQSSAAGPSQQGPPGRAERKGRQAEIQSSGPKTDSTRWLWRKYLRRWRRNVLLRRFREAWRVRHLVRAWLLWKDASQTEWLVHTLVRQRLVEWGWKVWRRRHLQTQVAECFLEAQDRSLLERAFGRWQQLAAERSNQPPGSFPPSLFHGTWGQI